MNKVENAITLNKWQHVVVTYSQDRRIRIYVNGQLKGTSQVYAGGDGFIKYRKPTSNVSISSNYNNSGYSGMMGAIDEVKIYNRELSPQKICLLNATNYELSKS